MARYLIAFSDAEAFIVCVRWSEECCNAIMELVVVLDQLPQALHRLPEPTPTDRAVVCPRLCVALELS